MVDANARLTKEQCRDAGFAGVLILLLIAYFGERLDFVLPAIGVMVLAMIVPALFRPWAVVWWGLARVLAAVGSRVLLTVVYALLVVPIGLFRRLLGADAMRTRDWHGAGSVFVEREGAFDAEDLEAPY
jgi:hypothetical protein